MYGVQLLLPFEDLLDWPVNLEHWLRIKVLWRAIFKRLDHLALRTFATIADHSVKRPVFAHARVVVPLYDVNGFVKGLTNFVAIS